MHCDIPRRLPGQQLHHEAVGILKALDVLPFAFLHVPVLVQVQTHLATAEVVHELDLQCFL